MCLSRDCGPVLWRELTGDAGTHRCLGSTPPCGAPGGAALTGGVVRGAQVHLSKRGLVHECAGSEELSGGGALACFYILLAPLVIEKMETQMPTCIP